MAIPRALRIAVACCVPALGIACRPSRSPAAANPALTRAQQVAAVGESLFVLELRGAQLAFIDSSGDGEGDEDLARSAFGSSIVMLRQASALDSTNGRAWHWLGEALARKAYRGFGEWDSSTVVEAIGALQQAKRFLAGTDPLRAANDSSLATEQGVLAGILQPSPSR